MVVIEVQGLPLKKHGARLFLTEILMRDHASHIAQVRQRVEKMEDLRIPLEVCTFPRTHRIGSHSIPDIACERARHVDRCSWNRINENNVLSGVGQLTYGSTKPFGISRSPIVFFIVVEGYEKDGSDGGMVR